MRFVRLPRLDEQKFNSVFLTPKPQQVTNELGAVVNPSDVAFRAFKGGVQERGSHDGSAEMYRFLSSAIHGCNLR